VADVGRFDVNWGSFAVKCRSFDVNGGGFTVNGFMMSGSCHFVVVKVVERLESAVSRGNWVGEGTSNKT